MMMLKEPPKPKKKLGFRTPDRFRRNVFRLAPKHKIQVVQRIPRTQHKV